ncbi:MAG TPA: RsmE family RNA methyltransferase [Spirochaetota bacterium]|nr:RsmE family RNA methyltransferase [Spirochaetota bacterium]
MPQYFVRPLDLADGRCAVRGEDFHHLVHVRRVAIGDPIELRLPDGAGVSARILSIGDDALVAEIIDKKTPCVVTLKLTLYSALLKGKKFDLVVQKAAELGVSRIVPVVTERTVPDIEEKESRRLERWNRIATEAAKQCMRADVPPVGRVLAFDGALGEGVGARIIAHPGGGMSARDIRRMEGVAADAALFVGPEGGFSRREIEAAAARGWRVMGFGRTQLRAETAAIVLPAILIYEWSLTE